MEIRQRLHYTRGTTAVISILMAAGINGVIVIDF